jgi:uncharacterized protein (TIGR01244 family)
MTRICVFRVIRGASILFLTLCEVSYQRNIRKESRMKRIGLVISLLLVSASLVTAQGQVKKESVPGITNYAHVETTVACAGAITPSSVAEIKKMGYASIINLRLANEPGADIDAEAAAAKSAGIKFVHLPLNGGSPDPAVVDRFLNVIVESGTQPAFIHCAGGNRAAFMWYIKRAVVDKWDTDRAMAEATQLGFTSEPLKKFAMDYIQTQKK